MAVTKGNAHAKERTAVTVSLSTGKRPPSGRYRRFPGGTVRTPPIGSTGAVAAHISVSRFPYGTVGASNGAT